MNLYTKICKLLDAGAVNIGAQLGPFIKTKLRSGEFKSMEDAADWFESEEGSQYIHKYVCIGMDLLPKRPKKTQAYSLFSRDRRPPNLIEGRRMWKELADVDKERYNTMAEEKYQADVAKFIEMFDGEPVADEAAKKEEKRKKAAEARAARKLAAAGGVVVPKKPRGRAAKAAKPDGAKLPTIPELESPTEAPVHIPTSTAESDKLLNMGDI